MEKLPTRSLAVPVPSKCVYANSGGPDRINRFCQNLYMDQHVPHGNTLQSPHKVTDTNFRKLTLSLFVFRIFTDNSDTSFSLDDFALFANRFY